MKWRLLIRGLCLGLFVVCLAAWAGSYWRGIVVERVGSGWDSMYVGHGRAGFLLQNGVSAAAMAKSGMAQGWSFDGNGDFRNYWWKWDGAADYRGLGFTYMHHGSMWQFSFPLLFPAFVSLGVLWLVWWWTRKRKGGAGFPVGVKGAGAKG
jgi:hypothetical protein